MTHAVEQLRLAAEIAENNFPINIRTGKIAQARLELDVSRDCRRAISALEQVKLAASFLSDRPASLVDYGRIGGRSILEGILGNVTGALGGASLGTLLHILTRGKSSRGKVGPAIGGGMALLGGAAGGLSGLGHGGAASYRNMKERNQSGLSRLVKGSSFLADKPGIGDYARVGGRAALQGGLGGYGAGALTSLLMGLVARRFPGAVHGGLARGLVSGMTGLGAGVGGAHGYISAVDNARQRLGPIGKVKRLLGIDS